MFNVNGGSFRCNDVWAVAASVEFYFCFDINNFLIVFETVFLSQIHWTKVNINLKKNSQNYIATCIEPMKAPVEHRNFAA